MVRRTMLSVAVCALCACACLAIGIALMLDENKREIIVSKRKTEVEEAKQDPEPLSPFEIERRKKELKEIQEDREAFKILMNYGVDDVYKEGVTANGDP